MLYQFLIGIFSIKCHKINQKCAIYRIIINKQCHRPSKPSEEALAESVGGGVGITIN